VATGRDLPAHTPADLGDHLFACLAVGAASEGDDLFEAADGELRRERR
jgi:hypothetical protein